MIGEQAPSPAPGCSRRVTVRIHYVVALGPAPRSQAAWVRDIRIVRQSARPLSDACARETRHGTAVRGKRGDPLNRYRLGLPQHGVASAADDGPMKFLSWGWAKVSLLSIS